MKKILFVILSFSIVFTECKKKGVSSNNEENTNSNDPILSENTIIVGSNSTSTGLVTVDSTKLIFATNSSIVEKIKVGSILVSGISPLAPFGFLRKVKAITSSGNNKVYTTEQALITDAINKCDIKYNRILSDADIIGLDTSGVDISAQERKQSASFRLNYQKVIYDADQNNSTTLDQILLDVDLALEPKFEYALIIENSQVKKFEVKLNLKNTNKINLVSPIILATLNREVVLQTYILQPIIIYIGALPLVFTQEIPIVLGLDGNLDTKINVGCQNNNTAVAGISYENGAWNTIISQNNAFSSNVGFLYYGDYTIEPWAAVRYELRPYGIQSSRIYLGVKGSIFASAKLISGGISYNGPNWGIKFSGKAQMQIWDKTILGYEKVFYEAYYPIIE